MFEDKRGKKRKRSKEEKLQSTLEQTHGQYTLLNFNFFTTKGLCS